MENSFEQFIHAMLGQGFAPGRAPDQHAHRCPACRHIWQHDRALITSEEQNEREHTCPSCGLNEDGCWIRYRGLVPITEEKRL